MARQQNNIELNSDRPSRTPLQRSDCRSAMLRASDGQRRSAVTTDPQGSDGSHPPGAGDGLPARDSELWQPAFEQGWAWIGRANGTGSLTEGTTAMDTYEVADATRKRPEGKRHLVNS